MLLVGAVQDSAIPALHVCGCGTALWGAGLCVATLWAYWGMHGHSACLWVAGVCMPPVQGYRAAKMCVCLLQSNGAAGVGVALLWGYGAVEVCMALAQGCGLAGGARSAQLPPADEPGGGVLLRRGAAVRHGAERDPAGGRLQEERHAAH